MKKATPKKKANAKTSLVRKTDSDYPKAVQMASKDDVKTPYYEWYQSGKVFRFRKRYKNGKIPNHQYNSLASCMKGIIADFNATLEMGQIRIKQVKK